MPPGGTIADVAHDAEVFAMGFARLKLQRRGLRGLALICDRIGTLDLHDIRVVSRMITFPLGDLLSSWQDRC